MKIKKFCDTDCPHFIENVEDLGGGQSCAWYECAWTGQVVENMDACPARVGMCITRDSMSTRKAQTDDQRVTCDTCDHLDTRDMQGQAAPVCFCRNKIWDKLHMAPHLIEHDTRKPIICSYWKAKEAHRQAVITWNPVKEVYDMDSPEEDTRIEGVLPEDGQTVLVSVYYANGERGVSVDVYCEDEAGGYFEDFTWEEVEAWSEMPQPYREEEDDDADSD